MNLCTAILRALEIEGEYDRHVFINSADEWVYWFGETVPEYLVRPVADLDRDTIEAYVDQWIADSQKRKESPAISDTASYYADQIVDHVIPEAAADGDLPEMPTNGGGKRKTGDKWVSPGRLVLTWPDLTGREQRVLFIMAAHGRDDGTNCYIGPTEIARFLGYGDPESDNARQNIKRVRRSLRDKGCITMTAKPRAQKPATYRINRGPRVV